MPQASPELRAEWPGGYDEAFNFLRERGFKLTRGFEWIVKPGGAEQQLDAREISAINFLIEEWDFGGIANVR